MGGLCCDLPCIRDSRTDGRSTSWVVSHDRCKEDGSEFAKACTRLAYSRVLSGVTLPALMTYKVANCDLVGLEKPRHGVSGVSKKTDFGISKTLGD